MIDPGGTDQPFPELLRQVRARLNRVRRIGHDVEVGQASYVPLDVELTVRIRPDHPQGNVLATLLKVLGAGVGPDGLRGFFHPDELDFGEAIHGGRIVAEAQRVAGVEWVRLTRLKRLNDSGGYVAGPGGLEAAVLQLEGFEIAQLNNDSRHPEQGRLAIRLEGGQ
jgi:hypothetical protein